MFEHVFERMLAVQAGRLTARTRGGFGVNAGRAVEPRPSEKLSMAERVMALSLQCSFHCLPQSFPLPFPRSQSTALSTVFHSPFTVLPLPFPLPAHCRFPLPAHCPFQAAAMRMKVERVTALAHGLVEAAAAGLARHPAEFEDIQVGQRDCRVFEP